MARKPMYSFAEKKHSQKGIVSSVLGGVSLLIFFVLAYLSYYFGGKGGAYLGGFGLAAMIMSLTGLVYGFMSLMEKNSLSFFPKLGALLNGGIFIGWIGIILIGIGK